MQTTLARHPVFSQNNSNLLEKLIAGSKEQGDFVTGQHASLQEY